MRILYLRRGAVFPELYAGTGLAMHGLLQMLKARGHEVATAAVGPRLAPGQGRTDRDNGYPTVRAPYAAFQDMAAQMVARWRPQVLVATQAGPWLEQLLARTGPMPVVVYEHEITKPVYGPGREARTRMRYVANSELTAQHLREIYGLKAVVAPPLFGIEQYAGVRAQGDKVLFVSLQMRKGADVAVRIAQSRPETSFVFCETWSTEPVGTPRLREVVGRTRNITLLPNQPGLAAIFAQTRLLLMPSRSQEAWGRTATEAQLCGIPVLGSSRGSLPRTIGAGGVTLEPNAPLAVWLEAFDRMMGEGHAELSALALAQGQAMLAEVERSYLAVEQALGEAAALA